MSKYILILSTLTVFWFLTSCQGNLEPNTPYVGGPCSYAPFHQEAVIIAVDSIDNELRVVFQAVSSNETFSVSNYGSILSPNDSLTVPKAIINATVNLVGQKITSGTCQPYVIHKVTILE